MSSRQRSCRLQLYQFHQAYRTLAVREADVLGDAFMTALKVAADGSSEKISAFLPGTCESALSLALELGMRITFPMLLMASPGYSSWTRYLPRNPGFM
jgi:hypothetical protein